MITITVNDSRPTLRGFRYFWLKNVTGFRETAHCAKCLIGTYCDIVSKNMPTNETRELPCVPGDLFYLCGVAQPYRHENNAHLAFVADPAACAQLTLHTGAVVTIQGARALPFDDAAALRRFPDRSAAYLTCRNFQFAAQHFPAAA